MNLGNRHADGLVHEIVDEDDHGRLLSKCGCVFPWIHPAHRDQVDETIVTCFQCLTPEEARFDKSMIGETISYDVDDWLDAVADGREPTPLQPVPDE